MHMKDNHDCCVASSEELISTGASSVTVI